MKPLNFPRRRALRRGARLAGGLVAAAFLALNAVAFLQARAMTHYVRGGAAAPAIEKLSRLQRLKVLLAGSPMPRPVNRKTPGDVGLPCEPVQLTGAHGLPLEAWWVRRAGARGTVLMFHGHGGSKASLLPAARAFRELGLDTLLVDFHGSGGSGGAETSVGYHEATDVAAALTWAKQAKGPVVLYGVSMGADAILRAMHLGDAQPAALVLECPFDRLVNTVGNRFRMMGVPAFPCAQLLVFWGSVQQGINGFALCPDTYAQSVRCPTLLLAGGEDRRVGVAATEKIFANLSCPKRLHVFPGLGHESYLAARPEEWQTLVGDFLQTALPPP